MHFNNLTGLQKLLLGVLLLILIGLGASMLFGREGTELLPEEEKAALIPGPRSFDGTYECLPHRDTSGPQTLECAFGIQTDDGDHHGLSLTALAPSLADTLQTGTRIRVQGVYVPVEALSSDAWQRYDIEGILQVDTLELI